MFQASLCPSSGEQDRVLLHVVFCTGCAGCGCVELGRKLCALCEGYCLTVDLKNQSLWFDFNLHYKFWSYFRQSSDTTFKTSWGRRKHSVLHWPVQSKHTPFALTFLQTHVRKIRSTLWYQQCYNLPHLHKVLIQVLFIFAQFRPLFKSCSNMCKHERQLQR